MIRDVLSNLGGIGLYGVLSVCLFFSVFLGVMIWACRLRKPWLSAMGQLPLEDEESGSRSTPGNAAPPQSHD